MAPIINHASLRRGRIYAATTRHHTTTGEFLGLEAPYGDFSILLRHDGVTTSIELADLTDLRPAA
jgi:hypothetical protein